MAMGFKHFNFFALLAGLALILAVHAQDQSGIYYHHLNLPIYITFVLIIILSYRYSQAS
jgi:hypothetical protein